MKKLIKNNFYFFDFTLHSCEFFKIFLKIYIIHLKNYNERLKAAYELY